MALLMEAVCTSETSGYSNQTARRNIQKATYGHYKMYDSGVSFH
jgi:hypothetical protein